MKKNNFFAQGSGTNAVILLEGMIKRFHVFTLRLVCVVWLELSVIRGFFVVLCYDDNDDELKQER